MKRLVKNTLTVLLCSLLIAAHGVSGTAGLAGMLGEMAPITAEAASVKTGWKKDGRGHWLYYKGGKAVKNRWLKVSGKWYLFNSKGYALTGWQKKSGKWYYMNKKSCAMQTGWIKDGGKWYYLDPTNGDMKTGWITVNGHKYYLKKSGAMVTGKQTIDGKTYNFGGSGALKEDTASTTATTVAEAATTTTTTAGTAAAAAVGAGAADANGTAGNGAASAADKTTTTTTEKPAEKKKVIVIDPGHSSKIPSGSVPLGPGSSSKKAADAIGTRGVATGIMEYELVLTVSQKLKTELEKRGYEVYMTRYDSKGTHSCIERAEVANSKKADVFIRVHANGSSDRSVTGAMTICITKNNPYIKSMYQKSKLLSDCVLNSYVKATGCRKEYVWETDSMTGNNWSKVPTTMIELGYMTNKAEDKLMATSAYQTKMVAGMANGIDEYFKKLGK